MKSHRNNNDMPKVKLVRVDDFLPPPEKLVMPENAVKITIRINESSIKFFKREAEKHHTKYQKMIRHLLDRYAEKYSY